MQTHFQSCRCQFLPGPFAAVSGAALALNAGAAPTDDVYLLGPDSMSHSNAPHGKVVGPLTLARNIFTNTTRNYWIYVPVQYDPSNAACLMIFQDGHTYVNTNGEWRVPNAFDNLIYRREMRVTLAVFIHPGHTPWQLESTDTNWGDGANGRATEYNELNDHYARLILDELLPALEKDYDFSKNPGGRAIAGTSSGAICAFTVAWQRPDQSTRSSAPSAVSPTFAAATFFSTSSSPTNPNPSASFCRTA